MEKEDNPHLEILQTKYLKKQGVKQTRRMQIWYKVKYLCLLHVWPFSCVLGRSKRHWRCRVVAPLPSTKGMYFPFLILLLLHLRLRLNKAMNSHGETSKETSRVFGLEMIWKFLFSIDIFSVIRAHTKGKKKGPSAKELSSQEKGYQTAKLQL